jgi:hypothetical protein
LSPISEPGSALRDAVGWALARIAPPADVDARARAAIARCLDVLETSAWPEAIACFSGLNADGCPIELAFSSRDHAVRFTIEAAPPEVAEAERLARAERLLVDLGGGGIPDDLRAELVALQAAGPLAWGAAIAGRHAPAGDRFKLYVEVPALSREVTGLRRAPRLVMIGWEHGSDVVERYHRCGPLTRDELHAALDDRGLGDRSRELAHAMSVAWSGSVDATLDTIWGLSLAGRRGGEVEVVSLFKEANRLFGGDARTRAGVLGLVDTLAAGELGAYARVAGSFVGRPGTGAHGMLAFTMGRGRPLELRVGVSVLAAWRAA